MDSMDDPKAPLLPIQDSTKKLAAENVGSKDSPHAASSPPSLGSQILTPNNLCMVLGPTLCLVVCVCARGLQGRNMLAALVWVFTWWVTEAVPMPVTSLAPLFLFPLLGIAEAEDVARSYMNDINVLILGSFMLVLAVEQYDIHRKLALKITLLFCGEPLKPRLLLFGICATSAFVSMGMHNDPAAVLMIPVATGILQRLPASRPDRTAAMDEFSRAVILGVTYAVAIGGMSTLTGTGVNLILVGTWSSYYPEATPITFSNWFLFGFPPALMLLIILWAILCFFYVPKDSGKSLSGYLDKTHLRRELDSLGPMAFPEKMVVTIFSILIVLWMTRNITDDIPGWGVLFNGRVRDGTISVLMATLLFIIPNKQKKGEKLMDWDKCKKLPWNIILLLGAGLAMADGVRSSGLANVLSEGLGFLENVPYWAITPAVCVVTSGVTELITSNNATTLLFMPILIQLAETIHVHPLLLMIPGALGTQFAYLFPTSTPSNTVGFVAGNYIEVKDMIKIGFLLKIAAISVISLAMPTLGAYIFGTNQPL